MAGQGRPPVRRTIAAGRSLTMGAAASYSPHSSTASTARGDEAAADPEKSRSSEHAPVCVAAIDKNLLVSCKPAVCQQGAAMRLVVSDVCHQAQVLHPTLTSCPSAGGDRSAHALINKLLCDAKAAQLRLKCSESKTPDAALRAAWTKNTDDVRSDIGDGVEARVRETHAEWSVDFSDLETLWVEPDELRWQRLHLRTAYVRLSAAGVVGIEMCAHHHCSGSRACFCRPARPEPLASRTPSFTGGRARPRWWTWS